MTNPARSMSFLISTGHLGTAPSSPESFEAGMATNPDFLVADGGSSDPGPVYLGANKQLGQFVEDELSLFLLAARKRNIPLLIGSAGDSGSNFGVDETVRQIKQIAEEHKLPKFKIGYFYSEVPLSLVTSKIAAGETIEGLGGFPDLTAEEAGNATRIVAVAGVHPFIKLLDEGCDVIIGGRCGDVCFTAAPAIRAGYPEALAYHMGKMIECASLVGEPFMGKESVIGTISDADIKITACHPDQRVTVASAAGHSMYERENPYFEHALGGKLDMSHCVYEQADPRTTRITGASWQPDKALKVKLEGARHIGERYMGIAAIRDPYVIKNIDTAIDWSREAVRKKFGNANYELHYHRFGIDGVLKEMEPVKETKAHEIAVLVEGCSPDEETALKVTDLATRMFFLARVPGAKSSSGLAACSKETMKSSPGYIWNVNHVMSVNDPMELFPTHTTQGGI